MRKATVKHHLSLMIGVLAISGMITGEAVLAQRPKNIDLTVDSEEVHLYSNRQSLKEALEEAGYTSLEGAETDLDLDGGLKDGMKGRVDTLKTVELVDGGKKREIKSHANSVKELLDTEGIDYDDDDVISPVLSEKLKDGMQVQLDHYERVLEEEEESIPYDTKVEKTAELLKGKSKVKVKGETGLRQCQTEVVKKNGQLFSRRVISQKTVKEPVTELVLKGTGKRSTSPSLYSLGDLRFKGVIYWGGKKFTYYSQRVLPGRGLHIPGRHVNSKGFVCDGDGYIVLANSAPKGTIISTPFGSKGKVYDKGTYGNHFDVYTR